MATLEEQFAGLGGGADLGASDDVVKPTADSATNSSKAVDKEMQAEFNKAIERDPSILARMNTKSKGLMVLNTLASNSVPGFIPGPNKTKEKSEVVKVSGIVGAVLKNISNEPIPYTTEEYKLDKETGRWVGTRLKKEAAPGQEFVLRTKYITLLTMEPEYSFEMANAKMVSGKKALKNRGNEDAILEAPHLQFIKVDDQPSKSVHADDVKIEIDDQNGKINKKFEATFGYLYNPEEKKERKTGEKKNKVTQQALAANLIRTLVEELPQA